MTEREKMLAGEVYSYVDEELVWARDQARLLTKAFNDAESEKQGLVHLHQLLATLGEGSSIQAPFRCDYGDLISIGKDCYINFGCVILDCNHVKIGDYVLIGPNTQIYAVGHPLDPILRRQKTGVSKPITIADGVWIGGGSMICAGVSIGENTVVGAGSVVNKSLPANVIAVGNPCRVLRTLEEGIDREKIFRGKT